MPFKPSIYLRPLQTLFTMHRNPTIAGDQAAYMREQFPFLGIPTPKRRALAKTFFAEHGNVPHDAFHDTLYALWDLEEREYQYFGCDLALTLTRRAKANDIDALEFAITHHSWWDTVDSLAKSVGQYLLCYPEQQTDCTTKWIRSKNIWLQRTAIIFQLAYKKKTNETLLFETILACSGSKEFFIQKGIGWALREYSRTNPDAVKDFVADAPLAALSKREALKLLSRNKLPKKNIGASRNP
jgi:3-methyladenine DNA glycosylase AlkD